MTSEQKKEILKALAYGLDEATAVACNGATVEGVRTLAEAEQAAVEAKRAELKEVYSDAF